MRHPVPGRRAALGRLLLPALLGVLSAPSAVRPAAAQARQASPAPSAVGLWRQVDDKTGQARSLIRIFESEGKLYGKVERVLDPQQANRTCQDCPGDMKGQPVLGLVFMRGLVRDGDGWSGGTIVDPTTGSTYRCSLKVAGDGRTLAVRGYLGVSLLGRTQTWTRES